MGLAAASMVLFLWSGSASGANNGNNGNGNGGGANNAGGQFDNGNDNKGPADGKTPPGQAKDTNPNGKDKKDNGYECDGNNGVGQGNPAHSHDCGGNGGSTTGSVSGGCPAGTNCDFNGSVNPQVQNNVITPGRPNIDTVVLGEVLTRPAAEVDAAVQAAPDSPAAVAAAAAQRQAAPARLAFTGTPSRLMLNIAGVAFLLGALCMLLSRRPAELTAR